MKKLYIYGRTIVTFPNLSFSFPNCSTSFAAYNSRSSITLSSPIDHLLVPISLVNFLFKLVVIHIASSSVSLNGSGNWFHFLLVLKKLIYVNPIELINKLIWNKNLIANLHLKNWKSLNHLEQKQFALNHLLLLLCPKSSRSKEQKKKKSKRRNKQIL